APTPARLRQERGQRALRPADRAVRTTPITTFEITEHGWARQVPPPAVRRCGWAAAQMGARTRAGCLRATPRIAASRMEGRQTNVQHSSQGDRLGRAQARS